MESGKEIEVRIEEALSALDNISRTGPGPFFYTRVQARMQGYKKSVLDNIISFLARPVVAVSIAVVVIIFNGIALIDNSDAGQSVPNYDIALAEEFNPLQIVTFYDPENP